MCSVRVRLQAAALYLRTMSTGNMARKQCGVGVQVLAVLLLGLVASSSAVTCTPGQGVAKTDILSLLGSLFSRQAAQPAGCSPCGNSEASRGGENAPCVTCTPGLSGPNADHTACECLPGSYAAGEPAADSVQRSCVSCGPKAVSTTRNAASCQACPEGAKATPDNKCGCEPGYVATGLGPLGVTGCRCDTSSAACVRRLWV